ncbi:MAG: DUF2442 domain-containing protein [Calditrichaeota bacterium]|nr:DUF2442 domain-containing protein [Calditrichota bacterium]
MELRNITKVQPLTNYRLQLWFDDGAEGIVDIGDYIPFTGVFKELANEAYFNRVRVNPEFGVIEWPNGADLDSEALYAEVTGHEIEITSLESLEMAC